MTRGNPGQKRARSTFQAILTILDIANKSPEHRSEDETSKLAAVPRQTLATWKKKESAYRARSLKGKLRFLHKGSLFIVILINRTSKPSSNWIGRWDLWPYFGNNHFHCLLLYRVLQEKTQMPGFRSYTTRLLYNGRYGSSTIVILYTINCLPNTFPD
jgi:hypothetical protein